MFDQYDVLLNIFIAATAIPPAIMSGAPQGTGGGEPNAPKLATLEPKELSKQESSILRSIIESSHDAIVTKNLKGIVTTWNESASRLFGYAAEEMIGKPISLIIPADRQDEETEILSRISRGDRVDHFETVRQRKDGSLIDISLTISPIRDAEGRIIGASKIARDIGESKRQADHIQFLMREMSHRMNNLLTVVQAMAHQTARSNDNYSDFTTRLNARLQGLASSNKLLVQQGWTGARIEDLVRLQLEPFVLDLDRFEAAGPSILLAPEAAQSIGLALHELATNASKYGALSNQTGRVRVEWEVGADASEPHFQLVWQESGGPQVASPTRKGFGTVVLETMTRSALACEAITEFAKEGLRWTLRCPASRVLPTAVSGPRA
jgi:PAS domain S-box-containing protein